MSTTAFSPLVVAHIAQLAHLELTEAETTQLGSAFAQTIDVIAKMAELDTSQVKPTHQVTGLTNVWRADEAQPNSSFTQAEALANAPLSHQGFFMVPQIIEQSE